MSSKLHYIKVETMAVKA